jgi:hypothetical protein
MYLQKVISKKIGLKIFFVGILKGSETGSVSQLAWISINVTDPHHCLQSSALQALPLLPILKY